VALLVKFIEVLIFNSAYDKNNSNSKICVKVINVEKFKKNKTVLKLINREIKTMRFLSKLNCKYIANLVRDCMSSKNIYMF
jgi:hypothetical protein